MNRTGLYLGLDHLLFPLLIQNSVMKHCWKECLDRLNNNDQSQKVQDESLSILTTEYAFGIIDGYIWKINLEEMISKIKSLFQKSQGWNEYLSSNNDDVKSFI